MIKTKPARPAPTVEHVVEINECEVGTIWPVSHVPGYKYQCGFHAGTITGNDMIINPYFTGIGKTETEAYQTAIINARKNGEMLLAAADRLEKELEGDK